LPAAGRGGVRVDVRRAGQTSRPVHLKTIKLRGFKSFVDPVEVRLEPGVAVVVGPNGSGKSNISDAILWATGSLSPHELRAEKPDDVLFAGSAGRKPTDFCEVELIFDNEDGAWPDLPFAEVSLARRLHRGGEGQYLVNQAAVRRIDLIELLSDVGHGGGLRSIISQGRVETVLAAKPAERRGLVEEAAGLGRFKLRRHRAELKLARVAIQVERARDLEDEVKKRLRPLALQATAAERAAKLGDEVARVVAAIAALDLARLGAHRQSAERQRAAQQAARRELDAKLETLLAARAKAEEELTDAAGAREQATAALYRLRSGAERLAMRREVAESFAARLAADLVAIAEAGGRERPSGPTPAQLARAADEAERVRDDLAARVQLTRERLGALEQSLAEREGLPPAARELAESGERLALSILDVDAGSERAVAAALGHRASAVLASDAPRALELVKRVRSAGLGSVVVLVGRDPRELVAELPVVPLEALLSSGVPAVTAEGFGWDPGRGELWFAGETAEAVLLELEARRRSLAAEVVELATRAEESARIAADAAVAAREAAAAIGDIRVHADPAVLRRISAVADRLVSTLKLEVESFEAPLRAFAETGTARTTELGAELRRLGADEVELRRATVEAAERLSALEVDLARSGAEAEEAQRRLDEAGADPAEGDDPAELAARLARLERRREQLGQVNPLAKEEYDAEKERLEELSAQRADLELSLAELEKLRQDLTDTVEQRFEETFAAVERHFSEVIKTLFPGGEGRLRLTDPEDEEGEHGIEVELRPAGKRVTRLSLLSGGEKALGAIAFLFSLFLSRPSPFYLLDEVEAALDDTNIGRFTGLLRTYADEAQFIVVTHQKRTMEAADVLYGVTMATEGVSQILSRRLPHDSPAAATA
jgi:chromosome segregation protein